MSDVSTPLPSSLTEGGAGTNELTVPSAAFLALFGATRGPSGLQIQRRKQSTSVDMPVLFESDAVGGEGWNSVYSSFAASTRNAASTRPFSTSSAATGRNCQCTCMPAARLNSHVTAPSGTSLEICDRYFCSARRYWCISLTVEARDSESGIVHRVGECASGIMRTCAGYLREAKVEELVRGPLAVAR